MDEQIKERPTVYSGPHEENYLADLLIITGLADEIVEMVHQRFPNRLIDFYKCLAANLSVQLVSKEGIDISLKRKKG